MANIFKLKSNKGKLNEDDGLKGGFLEKNSKTKKPDLNKYIDQEGVSITKLETGYWFVKNVRYFRIIFFVILGIISAVTWSLFIYNFGYYVIKGMKEDNTLVNDLVNNAVNHDATLSQKALPLRIGALN